MCASRSYVTDWSLRRRAASTIAGQYLGGMDLRTFIVRTCEGATPISRASSVSVGHSAIIVTTSLMQLSLHSVTISVNTHHSDYFDTMPMKRFHRLRMASTRGLRLREARRAAGFKSSRSAAMHFDWVYPTYNSHERAETIGGRDYDMEDAKRYARAFGVSPLWLFHGQHLKPIQSVTYAPRSVPVIGRVGAGDLGHFYEAADLGEIDGPRGATGKTVAVQVRGYSMEGIADDGSYVFYDEEPSPPSEALVGRLCVCWLVDGRVLFKRLYPGSSPDTWNLFSTNSEAILNVRVEKATRVRFIEFA